MFSNEHTHTFDEIWLTAFVPAVILTFFNTLYGYPKLNISVFSCILLSDILWKIRILSLNGNVTQSSSHILSLHHLFNSAIKFIWANMIWILATRFQLCVWNCCPNLDEIQEGKSQGVLYNNFITIDLHSILGSKNLAKFRS